MPRSLHPHWPSPRDVHTIAFDFDGVFTDNKVYLSETGQESVRCDRGDGLGIDILRRFRDAGRFRADIFVLSKEKNPVVGARARKLQIDCHQGIEDKYEWLVAHLARTTGRSGSEAFAGLIYLGNDLNDLPVMDVAGFSVAPDDAHPLVKQRASAVLPQRGGDGFIRAFVERFLGFDSLPYEEVVGLFRRSPKA